MLDANDVDDSTLEIPDSGKGGFQRRFGLGSQAFAGRLVASILTPLLSTTYFFRFCSVSTPDRSEGRSCPALRVYSAMAAHVVRFIGIRHSAMSTVRRIRGWLN